jgi:tetratricopeptide (TPR) repeat protein
MLETFKLDGNYSVNKIYLIVISLCTLLPGFGAIDNNPIRWISIGFVTIFFLFYENFISQNKINYKIPNLSSNVVPISTYLSRYYFNEGNYYESIRLLDYSLEINKLDLMTNELMLRNYIFTNQSNKALILVKDLLKRYPENKNYSNILSAISKDLNSKN